MISATVTIGYLDLYRESLDPVFKKNRKLIKNALRLWPLFSGWHAQWWKYTSFGSHLPKHLHKVFLQESFSMSASAVNRSKPACPLLFRQGALLPLSARPGLSPAHEVVCRPQCSSCLGTVGHSILFCSSALQHPWSSFPECAVSCFLEECHRAGTQAVHAAHFPLTLHVF